MLFWDLTLTVEVADNIYINVTIFEKILIHLFYMQTNHELDKLKKGHRLLSLR